MKVVALIPAYNEADRIATTIKAVQAISLVDEVIVINDFSQDDTGKVAQETGALVLEHSTNLGKGAALNYGWKQSSADVYLLLDADLGETAKYGEKLLEPVLSGQADMTIAKFVAENQAYGNKKMGFGFVRRFASWLIRLLTGKKFASPLSGQRAIRSEVLDKVDGFMDGFGVEVGLTVLAARADFQINEIPLPMRHRAHGRGLKGFYHRARQFLMICRAFWSCLRKGQRI